MEMLLFLNKQALILQVSGSCPNKMCSREQCTIFANNCKMFMLGGWNVSWVMAVVLEQQSPAAWSCSFPVASHLSVSRRQDSHERLQFVKVSERLTWAVWRSWRLFAVGIHVLWCAVAHQRNSRGDMVLMSVKGCCTEQNGRRWWRGRWGLASEHVWAWLEEWCRHLESILIKQEKMNRRKKIRNSKEERKRSRWIEGVNERNETWRNCTMNERSKRKGKKELKGWKK